MADGERSGQLFTDVYLAKGQALKDDPRMRRRLSALLRDVNHAPSLDFQNPLSARLGVEVPFGGYTWDWQAYFAECSIHDLLNSITVIYAHFRAKGYSRAAVEWRDGVADIFDQQNAAYRIEEGGGVRFRIDAAATAVTLSTIGTLNNDGKVHIAQLVDKAAIAWDAAPPDYAEGIRGIFFAAEELFKTNFPGAQRLVAFEIDARILPLELLAAKGNKAAEAAVPKVVESFKSWVSACHEYRHAKGEVEPKQPPGELGVLLVTAGMSWIRWLAPLTDI